ncbi:MAG: flavodoxin family protein [Candidatus Brocadiia bacterium]
MSSVIAVAGSARRNGNSERLLDAMLDGMREVDEELEVDKIVPRELDITPCRSCNGCWETGRCVIDDCMQDLYAAFSAADHVVVASPIYFTSLPGHLKVFIDRFQCFWVRTYRLGDPPQPRRKGAFICAGAMDRRRYFESCRTTVKTWLSTLNVGCDVSRFYHGLDAKEDISERDDYLADARKAGRELRADTESAGHGE